MQSEVGARTAGDPHRWRGLIFIGMSLLVIALDNTVLNVALPSIARSLNATATDLQWMIDAYVLVFAALLLTMGSVGDRIGRKKSLQIGLVLFAIGSLAAALSSSTWMLIASRAFLGVGGAMIMPATLSLISASFPPNERPQAIAIWAAVYALGVGVGPVIGGWLVQNFSWHAVFYINIPVIAATLIGGALYLSDSRDDRAPRPDIPGVVLSIIGLFALVYAIIEAGVKGWSDSSVVVAFVIAAVVLAAFGWWEARAPNAMLPIHFFRNMSFTIPNLDLVFLSFSLFGAIFFLTQYFQTILGYSSFEAGLLILPQAVTLMIASTSSARVARRIGTKATLIIGALLTATAFFYMSQVFEVNTPYWRILIGQLILACGLGMSFSPATNSIMASIPVRQAGIGSAMNDTTRQLGGAIGIAVLGTIMNSRYLAGMESLRDQLPSDVFALVASSVQRAHMVAADPELPAAASQAILATSREAFMSGMSSALLVSSAMMVIAAVIVLALLPARIRAAQPEPVPQRDAAVPSAQPSSD